MNNSEQLRKESEKRDSSFQKQRAQGGVQATWNNEVWDQRIAGVCLGTDQVLSLILLSTPLNERKSTDDT